jgi:hypothetical protein
VVLTLLSFSPPKHSAERENPAIFPEVDAAARNTPARWVMQICPVDFSNWVMETTRSLIALPSAKSHPFPVSGGSVLS